MNLKEENHKLIQFWNHWFEQVEPQAINPEDVKIENTLDEYLKELGDTSERILDIGTGTGFGILTAMLLGEKVTSGFGIDPAEKSIQFVKETCRLSGIEGLEFEVGTHQLLSRFENESFDGIVCSNVIDVVPEETSNQIINEIIRLLKPGGRFVLKLNFYLTDALIERIKMEEIAPNTFAKDGIIRGLNFTTERWVKKFDGLSLLKSGEFERVKNGPKDRVMMFVKNQKENG